MKRTLLAFLLIVAGASAAVAQTCVQDDRGAVLCGRIVPYGGGYDGAPPPPTYGGTRYQELQCPPNYIRDHDSYGRPRCRPWQPRPGSECPPGFTLQSGACKPYRGH